MSRNDAIQALRLINTAANLVDAAKNRTVKKHLSTWREANDALTTTFTEWDVDGDGELSDTEKSDFETAVNKHGSVWLTENQWLGKHVDEWDSAAHEIEFMAVLSNLGDVTVS